jgi:cysteine desulfurase/selenocysteine lyase
MSVHTKSAAHSPAPAVPAFDVERVRADFPILSFERKGKRLIYFDNAATSQKPRQVIETIDNYYRLQNANVHRGVHYLSELATDLYENARKKVQKLINAPLTCETIFTRGTTDAINLVAHCYGRTFFKPGHEVLISAMEHHSNIVPWQMICEQTGAKLRIIPINDAGEVLMDAYADMLSDRTKMVAVAHVSNALGTVNPVKQIVDLAHKAGAVVLVDGAQAVPHMTVDVKSLDCDFYALSGHKMCGPTGIGILYGRAPILDSMPPYQGGGDMILSVTFEKTVYNSLPYKFEAGTPNIEGAIGLGAAADYLSAIGMDVISAYEHELLAHGTAVLEEIDDLRIIGTAKDKASVLSFTLGGEHPVHPHDIGQLLDDEGIAVRAGHHCAQPVMQRFNVPATARASLSFYNTKSELDAMGEALHRVKKVFA